MTTTIACIGAGRVTRILLEGLARKNCLPKRIIVTDTNPDVLKKLAEKFPTIEAKNQVDESMSSADFLFISLHPPVVGEMLHNIVPFLGEQTTIVSLAPKIKIATINQFTGASRPVIRMIPNAASYVNEGYNPVVFGSSCPENIRKKFTELIAPLGQMPEVPEETLEAYAIVFVVLEGEGIITSGIINHEVKPMHMVSVGKAEDRGIQCSKRMMLLGIREDV
ncbi:pyrroline-5-carboxylate reductase [Methanospirillum hungatei]|uniref:pyrroline-5-carboxylate reductase family protein n=1 Tax=Methanospirillum hungatei TaxID=2203 RepID=UPI0026ED3C43|nr:NAD(P)-binding domain-containing protein [Methanospirillum hungatei]MCA1917004.1 NAD(P)-binding domain-containing protein [Methanospirillum hungatei]